MLLVCKVGNTVWDKNDPRFGKSFCDGHAIQLFDEKTSLGKKVWKHFAVFRVNGDFNPNDLNLKRIVTGSDAGGKYPWDRLVAKKNSKLRKRDYFIDYKWLVNEGYITEQKRIDIYNKSKSVGIIDLGVSLDTVLRNEDSHLRLDPSKLEIPGSITSGTHKIPTDYATWNLFEADFGATLSADLRGEGENANTNTTAEIIFDVDTATYKLYLIAESGAEHNGETFSGARITFGAWDNWEFKSAAKNVEISKLAMNLNVQDGRLIVSEASPNWGSGGDQIWFNRLLIVGGNNQYSNGIELRYSYGGAHIVTNCMVRGFIYSNEGQGISVQPTWNGRNYFLYNNTCVKNRINFRFGSISGGNPLITVKNNFGQGPTGVDYSGIGVIDVSAKNISEDTTSPDVAYRSLDKHSVFTDYDGNILTLASDDSDINDGEDLSGSFTDDINHNSGRRPSAGIWDIGASQLERLEYSSAHTAFRNV